MEARAIQIYKPVNKNEVRLVYRIKNSLVSGENGRHQKSYSFNKYGEENAWNMAKDAFKYINTNNKLPFDFSDPWKMKLINKKGKKNHHTILGGKNVINMRQGGNSGNSDSNYQHGNSDNNKLGLSPPSVTIDDQIEYDSAQSPISGIHSSEYAYKHENKIGRKKQNGNMNVGNINEKNNRIHASTSSLYILALAAAEMIEEEDSLIAKKIPNIGFDNSVEIPKQPQIVLPETKKENPLSYSQQYGNIINDPIYGFPLLFNGQFSNPYIAAAVPSTASLLSNVESYMVLDPSFQYFGNNNFNVQK
ncbi:hypothetical protein FG386_002802 [Cryptosporidium ryanae]|uniref:uncharacterized protein n=1 Tax=Cryptosporidium ryanae TaxID=515981 RepID=UPI00351A5C4B|nr:hypothetical protein FG386_002802 [Cryptosporidium ryanae]